MALRRSILTGRLGNNQLYAYIFFHCCLGCSVMFFAGAIVYGLSLTRLSPNAFITASIVVLAAFWFLVVLFFGIPSCPKIEKLVSKACQDHGNIALWLFCCFHWLAFSIISGLSDDYRDFRDLVLCNGHSSLSVTALCVVKMVVHSRRDSSTVACWYLAVYVTAVSVPSMQDLWLFFPLLLALLSLLIPLDLKLLRSAELRKQEEQEEQERNQLHAADFAVEAPKKKYCTCPN